MLREYVRLDIGDILLASLLLKLSSKNKLN
jgi:hypothetical protein